ncbi:SMC family ATPase [[Clostridium] spiroforme]|nr:SMC family ATPase [Thomasclavelia spiroformis]MBM6880999.1 SMC family ATPase [Thomasclavelia spiroformis]
MMPLNLTISAFGPYPEQIIIDFTQFQESGLFLITGPTGSGKTMIFDAIVFALYGKSSGQMRESDSLRCDHAVKETPTYVEYSFALHDQIYTVKRSPKYYVEGRKTAKAPSALLTLPDGKMVEGVREVDHRIVALLGVDEKQFKQIAMIAQGEFTKLIMSSSEERERVLRNLFHTEVYQRLEEKLKEKLKLYRDKYDHLLKRKNQLISELKIDSDDFDLYLHQQEALLQKQQQSLAQMQNQHESKKHTLQLYHLQNQRILKLENLSKQYQQLCLQEADFRTLKTQIMLLKQAKDTNYYYQIFLQEQRQHDVLSQNLKAISLQLEKSLKNHRQINEQYAHIDEMKNEKNALQDKVNAQKKLIDDIYRYHHDYQEKQSYLQEYQSKQEEFKLLLQRTERLENSVLKDQETINDEARLKMEFELAQKKFQSANERKIKIHELSQLNDQYVLESDKRSDLQEIYQALEKEFYQEKNNFDEMEKLFYRQQAGIFASKLEEGKPCPVCGSLHHPQPAALLNEEVTTEKLNLQKRKVNSIQERFNDNRQQLMLKTQLLSTIQERIEQSSEELRIDSELTKELFIKELNKTNMIEREIKKSYATMNDELKYIQKLKTSIALSKKDLQKYQQELEKRQLELTELNNQIHKIEGRLNESFAEYDIDDQKELYQQNQQQLHHLENTIDHLQQKFDKSDKERLQLETKQEAFRNQMLQQDEKLNKAENDYLMHLKQYESETDFFQLKDQIEEIESLEKTYQDHMIKKDSLAKQIASLQEEVQGLNYIELEDLETELKKLEADMNDFVKEVNQSQIALALQKNKIEEIRQINSTMALDEEKYQRYLDLSNVTSGKNEARVSLERYVLAAYFEKILLYANEIMKKLTQGRYVMLRKDYASKGMAKQGLELDVFDYESGLSRDIRTLSGGESFKAALSLALGLSQMIQDHAGGIELNTLFIDEGFGTLDMQSLDQAINCLIELHQDNKLIGIISHVSELKDRIDCQIVISRERKESKISII